MVTVLKVIASILISVIIIISTFAISGLETMYVVSGVCGLAILSAFIE